MKEHLHSGGAPRRTLAGYAVLFHKLSGPGLVMSQDGRKAKMRAAILPGAFRTCLARGDNIVARLNHEPRKFLGGTYDHTLSLREDARGLSFRLDLPPDERGDEVLAMRRRGQLAGMSIAFVPHDEEERRVLRSGERVRLVLQADLVDVSAVAAPAAPAYPGTRETLYVVLEDYQHHRLAELERELGSVTPDARWADRRVRLHALECEFGLS